MFERPLPKHIDNDMISDRHNIYLLIYIMPTIHNILVVVQKYLLIK